MKKNEVAARMPVDSMNETIDKCSYHPLFSAARLIFCYSAMEGGQSTLAFTLFISNFQSWNQSKDNTTSAAGL
ncbi:hypothetical protein [Novipirellula rosea]|uniref:hypothetical protein n=1 Tax=Novipirellula rosea TaxID=1031540 RepID=UPI0030EDB637